MKRRGQRKLWELATKVDYGTSSFEETATEGRNRGGKIGEAG